MARRVSSTLRTLDRYLGIPALLAFAAAPKRRPPEWSTVKRIGVLKTAAIGDTLLLASALDAIRRRHPTAELTLITGANNAPAVELLRSAIDRHVIVSVRSPASAIASLRALRLDVLLECGPWPRYDALIATLSGARYRVGFRVRGQARHFGFDCVIEHSSHAHQVENLNRLAAAIDANDFRPPRLQAPGRLGADRLPAAPFAVFHPWSGGYMGHVKEWPADRWVELAERLCALSNVRILISGSAADADDNAELARRIQAAGVPAESIAGRFSLAELADVLVASEVVVSVNTGVMHLAALVGARTVSLEGPVPPKRWGPVGPYARSVVTTLPGSGYLDLGFEYAGRRLDCMTGVSVDAVMDAIEDLLDSPKQRGEPIGSPRVG